MLIDFQDIIISPSFAATPPSESKLKQCRELYGLGVLDRDIVVNKENILVDGYVLYCVMKENGYTGNVKVEINPFYGIPTTYVFGKHPGDDKERVWYINMSYDKIKHKVGQIASVQTRKGNQPITVTRIERLKNPPVQGLIRKVVFI